MPEPLTETDVIAFELFACDCSPECVKTLKAEGLRLCAAWREQREEIGNYEAMREGYYERIAGLEAEIERLKAQLAPS